MRYIIIGAGAVGGAIGGRLHESGHDVVLVARGAHGRALRESGLRLNTPGRSLTLPIPVAEGPDEVHLRRDDVLVLAVKSQDSVAALDVWAARPVARGGTAGESLPVLTAQNGVVNETLALRRFRRVYGVCVWLPAQFLEPGQVTASAAPLTGMLHLGRFPGGVDDTARRVALDLERSRFLAPVVPDVMRWKYAKLLANLGNAIEALCGPIRQPPLTDLLARARAEGVAVLAAAGIAHASEAEQAEARGDRLEPRPVGAPSGVAAPRGRACAGARARSRPTTSTARSCCSAGPTGWRRRSTSCSSGRPTTSPAAAARPAHCRSRSWPRHWRADRSVSPSHLVGTGRAGMRGVGCPQGSRVWLSVGRAVRCRASGPTGCWP